MNYYVLIKETPIPNRPSSRSYRAWKGTWTEKLNHAAIFESKTEIQKKCREIFAFSILENPRALLEITPINEKLVIPIIGKRRLEGHQAFGIFPSRPIEDLTQILLDEISEHIGIPHIALTDLAKPRKGFQPLRVAKKP